MSREEQETEVSWRPLVYLAAFVIAIWFFWGHVLLRYSSTIAEAGQTGDLYGGINALFSGLAFAALIFTVHLQRKELSDQRKELKATRGVFQQQERQMQEQNTALRKQIFEARFFQWVNLHHSLVGALKYSDQDGRKVLAQIRNFFLQQFRRQLGQVVGNTAADIDSRLRALASERFATRREEDRAALVQAYEESRNQYINELAHYHENLYEIFAFLIHSGLTQSDRNFYVNIVRAQLSIPELLLLFGHGLTDRGRRFATVIEELGLLSNLTDAEFFIPEHRSYYAASAYRAAP